MKYYETVDGVRTLFKLVIEKYYTIFADECTIENGCLEMVRNYKEGVLKNTQWLI